MFDYCRNEFNLSPDMMLFSQLNEDTRRRYFCLKFSRACFMKLPKTVDEFRRLHRKKYWYNLKRSQGLFEKHYGALEFKIVADKAELMRYLPEVFKLFRKRWEGRFTSCNWKTKSGEIAYTKALLDLAKQNRAFLAVLTGLNDTLLSYGYCLCEDSTVYFYQHSTDDSSEYRRFSLGKIFIALLLENLVKQGTFRKFDFMVGSQSYKLEWASGCEDVYKLFPKNGDLPVIFFQLIRVLLFFLKQLIAKKKFLRAVSEKILLSVERLVYGWK